MAGLNLVEISSGEKKGKRKIRTLYRYKVDIKNVEKIEALTVIAAKMLLDTE